MYLLGHKQPATTARYMRPQKDAAAEVYARRYAQFIPGFWWSTPKHPTRPTHPTRRNPERLLSCARRGLEPPWLLTASTSNGGRPSRPNDSQALERQETSVSVSKRQIPVTCDRNSGGIEEVAPLGVVDPIALRLEEADRAWTASRDPRALRRALLELLRALDE